MEHETPRRGPDELREERRNSSGRESWVYRADGPDVLRGRHADLLRSALSPDDRLHYLLYAPIFDGVGGPFGIRGTPASHAVAVAHDRLIITADAHRDEEPANIYTIPFAQILSVELGAALLLGWLRIRHVDGVHVTSTLVTFSTTGTIHFEAVVRTYRALTAVQISGAGVAMPSAEVWRATAPFLRSATEPLLLRDEPVLLAVHWAESWRPRKGGWRTLPSCVSTPGLLLIGRAGLLWACSEPRLRPDLLTFGVNVTSINWRALQSASVERGDGKGGAVCLRLILERDGVVGDLEIPVGPDADWAVDDALRALERMRRSAHDSRSAQGSR